MPPSDVAGCNVVLTKGRSKAVAMRHPWVFAEAVGRIDGRPAAGDLVEVQDHLGRFIGYGYYSPKSKIRVKLFCWTKGEAIGRAFWRERLEQAVSIRRDVLGMTDGASACRLVNSEGDWTPGLTVDRYADFLVVEFGTPGMAERAQMFAEVLMELTGAAGIHERVEADAARFEGFKRKAGVLAGDEPPEFVEIEEGCARLLVEVRGGQKTGFYLDQRDNRLRAARFAKGRRVLDAFCYTGGFAVQAALAGAQSVTAVDSSAEALETGRKNAELNGVDVEFVAGNAFERLRMLQLEGQTFDMVIVDPPKLARGRPGVPKALRAYKDADLSALRLLSPGGILVTCCCSGIVSTKDFLRALNDASVDADRRVTVLETHGPPPDHTVATSCPETDYLKCVIARVE